MKEIAEWLKGPRHYRVGVMLYLKHGTNALLKKSLVDEPESKYKKDKLVKSFERMLEKEVQPLRVELPSALATGKKEKAPTNIKPETSNLKPELASDSKNPLEGAEGQSFTPKSWSRSDCKDDYEIKLWEKAMRLLKEIAAHHANLSAAFSDYERREIAFNLLRKDDELDAVYEERDYYRQHKVAKEAAGIEYITDPFLMAQRLVNLKRYIRREKQNIVSKGDTSDRRERLSDYVKEYNYYAEKMQKPFLSC